MTPQNKLNKNKAKVMSKADKSNNAGQTPSAKSKNSNAISRLVASLSTRRSGKQGAASAEAEARRQTTRKRNKAKETAEYIGYDALFADGIAEVEPGLFSQTLEFSDISYQSSRKETQEQIFTTLSSVYNYFPAGTTAELTIVNTPVPREVIGRREFFKPHDETTAKYAEEYNRILNDKLREGVSNLTRRRFLTYSVSASDVDAAVHKLAHIRDDVSSALVGIRCESRVLSGPERLEVFSTLIRPGKTPACAWEKFKEHPRLRTKDLIAPNRLDFAPYGRADIFEADGTFASVLYLRDFGSVLEDHYLASIIDLQIPLAVSIHITPIVQSEAIKIVKRQIDWMDKEIIDEQTTAAKKGFSQSILTPEIRYSKEEAEELLDFLRNKNEHLFEYTGLIYTYADTVEALERQVEQIISVAQGNSLGISPLDFRQKPALNSVLPLARNHVDFTRYLTTGQVAMQMPFASLELNQPGGGYYGQSKQSGSLVLCDRKQLPSPMGFVCGKPGSGKSFSIKREITNTVLAYPEDQIIIFDPAGEYTNLIDSMGGVNIALSTESTARLSPFTITECDGYTRELQIASKTDVMLALAHSIFAEGDRALEGSAESIITRCVGQAYANTSGAEPTLNDFYEALKRQPEPEATTLALHFERYVEGPLKSFCGQGNIAFTERIVNIDLHKLSANMKTFGMIIALEAVFGQIHANFERGVTTWVYIDEVQSFFSHKTIIEYFEKFWAEGRKAGLIATGITQNATYMLAHETARTLVLNSDFILLHKQSALDRKSWVDMLALSATEEGYIDDTAAPGEGLLVAGGVRVPIRDNFPKGALYDLFNTKPTEIAEAKRAARLAG